MGAFALEIAGLECTFHGCLPGLKKGEDFTQKPRPAQRYDDRRPERQSQRRTSLETGAERGAAVYTQTFPGSPSASGDPERK